MRRYIAVAVLISALSCSQHHVDRVVREKVAPCSSTCGMLLETVGNGAIDCATIDEQELAVLTEAERHFAVTDPRFYYTYSCSAVFGWQVEADVAKVMVTSLDFVAKDAGMLVTIPVSVDGLTKCNTKQLWLGGADYWQDGAYSHELLHIVQSCHGLGPEDSDDRRAGTGHEGWTEQGLFHFVEQFRNGSLP